jgi:hypothetical protein
MRSFSFGYRIQNTELVNERKSPGGRCCCREAFPERGRFLIVEIVLAGRPIGHPHRLIDLEKMVTLGGRERSEREFAALLEHAGLRLTTVTPVAESFFFVVEAALN